VTLVERQSRYVILAKVANKETATVVSALIRRADSHLELFSE
jgi:IS30 family transposase